MFIIEDLIFLDSIAEKLIWKHNVTPIEIEEVLSGNYKIFKKENGRIDGEHLYNALCKTNNGRYLSVFFIKKLNNNALIITARDMTKDERKRYEKK